MNIRATIALFMGLLLQLSQVQAFPDAVAAKSCGAESASMSCCASKQVCPCIGESESTEIPAPLAPAAPVLKLVFIQSAATADTALSVAGLAVGHHTPRIRAASTAGYPGVPLSVAFCSFVI